MSLNKHSKIYGSGKTREKIGLADIFTNYNRSSCHDLRVGVFVFNLSNVGVIMEKEEINVGGVKWKARTIPVNIVYDRIFLHDRTTDSFPFDPSSIADRFQIFEVDGAHIVIQESILMGNNSVEKQIAFCNRWDAFRYLNLFGVCPEEELEDGQDEWYVER